MTQGRFAASLKSILEGKKQASDAQSPARLAEGQDDV
jgi:hypothetical protein